MSVDLADLVPDLEAEINPPGSDEYPNATTDDMVNRLRNAFWEARLQGAFPGYSETDGIVTSSNGAGDLPREHQQLIIILAGLNIAIADYRHVESVLRSKAGPVEYETQRSATLLKTVIETLRAKLAHALVASIEGPGDTGNTAVFDAVIVRTESITAGTTWWVR
jgi:hypothetical protein